MTTSFLAHRIKAAQRLTLFLLLGITSSSTYSRAQATTDTMAVPVALADIDLPDAPSPQSINNSIANSPPHVTLALLNEEAQTSQSEAPQQKGSPSLEDLGLAPEQTRSDPDTQALLDRRSKMLKIHQRLGIITLAPLAAACLSSAAAPPDPRNGGGNTIGRDIHLSLGTVSVLSYGATAYYAIRAPKIGSEASKGGIKWHKYLIYVHAPGMVLTPILGAMAFNQANNGQKVHGIASAHSAVAWTTVVSYSTAILAVSWPLNRKH